MPENHKFVELGKLFLAESLYSTMKPVFYMTKCFGLVHFTYEYCHGVLNSKLSILLVIFNVVCLLIANSTYVIYIAMWVIDMPKFPVISFSLLLQSLIAVACNCIAFYISLVHNQKIISIFHMINNLEQYFEDPQTVYSEKRRTLIMQMIFVVIGTVIALVVSWQSVGGNATYIFMYICFFINEMSNSSLELQYLTFVSLLRQHFHAVNVKLDEGRALTNVFSPKECSRVYYLQISVPRTKIQKKYYIKCIPKSSIRKAKRFLNITVIYHDSLCDIVQLVNVSYSIFVLISIAKMFLAVSCTLFITLSKILSPAYTKSDDVFGILTFRNEVTPWCALYIIKFLYLVYTCSTTSDEANKAAIFVHKLISITKDQTIKEELQHFSLQLIHRRVQLSASGFFPVDFTLLYSIVAAVTTYLVILAQFQLTVDCSNDSSNATNWNNILVTENLE